MKLKTGISELLNIEKNIILASQSPRRKQLLSLLGLEFTIIPAHIDESVFDHLAPKEQVMNLALSKAKEILEKNNDSIIIGSDTVVALDNEILNKPKTEEEAFKMLRKLSDNTHTVYTGISIISSEKEIMDYQATEVSFRELSDSEIKAYINTGSPMDKAGSYGIQDDFGAVFVSNIKGCYYNIVGLPLELLYKRLKEFSK